MTDAERLSHLDEKGDARMVDVSAKEVTLRRARAQARVRMKASTERQIVGGKSAKGDVLTVARVAGIQAAKRTGELIPLCHPLPVEQIRVDFSWANEPPADEAVLIIDSEAVVTAKTGVEMEALTAASVASLTVYDMCKAVDRAMVIESVRLTEKSGGRSGTWRAAES